MKKVSLIIKIVLLVIIPLLVATGIGVYSYRRYKGIYGPIYIDNISYKNTAEKIDKYVKFCSSYYEELTDLENSVQTDGYVLNDRGEKLFSLKAYRWFDVDEDDSVTMNYIFILYNINYGNVFYTIYNRGTNDIKFSGYLPQFEIKITDYKDQADDEDDLVASSIFAYNSEYTIEDYNYVGYTKDDGTETKRYEDNLYINANTDTKWALIKPDTDFSENVNITITAVDSKYANNTDEELVKASTITAVNIDIADYITRTTSLNTEELTFNNKPIIQGFETDVEKAGYGRYVFGHYMWWEMLIAIVLTEIVTGSTVLVWTYDFDEKKNKNNNK